MVRAGDDCGNAGDVEDIHSVIAVTSEVNSKQEQNHAPSPQTSS
jgi:hypothetical protein